MSLKPSFQTIVLIICGLIIAAGVTVISLISNDGNSNGDPTIPDMSLWGTLPSSYFAGFSQSDNEYLKKVRYRQISPADFDQRLIEALANNQSPDMLILSQADIRRHQNKILQIPFDSFPASTYYRSYIDSAAYLANENGIFAVPITVDPMMLYYNRDHFKQAGLINPPQTWNELRNYDSALSVTDGFIDLERSSIALGTYTNINHAEDILGLLFMQAGSDIVSYSNGRYAPDVSTDSGTVGLGEALDFYITFANPQTKPYSWNVALPSSNDAFTSGDLSMYFGFASEYETLRRTNPNIDIGIAVVPQVSTDGPKQTYADIYGVAVSSRSPNAQFAYQALYAFLDGQNLAGIEAESGLPSVMLSRLAPQNDFIYTNEFIQSALLSSSWYKPEPAVVENAFRSAIEGVRSSGAESATAVTQLIYAVGTE